MSNKHRLLYTGGLFIIPILFCCLFFWLFVSGVNLFKNNDTAVNTNKTQTEIEISNDDEDFSFLPDNEENNPFADFDINSYLNEEEGEIIDPLFDASYPIIEIKYENTDSNILVKNKNAYLKNYTQLDNSYIQGLMNEDINFTIEKNSSLPQILIMHTHATESFQKEGRLSYDPLDSFRSTDMNLNITSAGKVLADTLNELGYNTIHDTTLHDYPSYNYSYDRSKKTVQDYLDAYPSIKIVLDVHRDAIENGSAIISATTSINSTKYAQIMIISGADNGAMNMPNYTENLKFASALQNSLETLYPTITRPILFDYRHYNQDLTTGSLLIELGSHGNTLEQTKQSARAVAYCIARIFDNP